MVVSLFLVYKPHAYLQANATLRHMFFFNEVGKENIGRISKEGLNTLSVPALFVWKNIGLIVLILGAAASKAY